MNKVKLHNSDGEIVEISMTEEEMVEELTKLGEILAEIEETGEMLYEHEMADVKKDISTLTEAIRNEQ